MIWQCSCSARIEADSKTEAGLIARFVKLHKGCPSRWRPEEAAPGDVALDALTERRPSIGFGRDE